MVRKILGSIFLLLSINAVGQSDSLKLAEPQSETKTWYENFKIGGYLQIRYNDLYKTNPDLEHPQGDKSYGGHYGINIRRMRLKLDGMLHPRLYFYFQTDFASDGKNLGQLRDAYADIFLTTDKVWRIRAGQSKIPFGFENLQSSQHRITPDRAEAVNSALKDERDLNIGLYWTPLVVQERFAYLKKHRLKGSGNYGAFNLTFFNGQKANELLPDENSHVDKTLHRSIRFTWPFQFENEQILEVAIQGYAGDYYTKTVSDGVYVKDLVDASGNPVSALNYLWEDRRAAFSFNYYPQPFGLHSEISTGVGPEYDPATNTIGTENLFGAYIQACYMLKYKEQIIIPFSKWQYYDGGKKFELDARSYTSYEIETGVEWQPFKQMELAVMYTWADRRFEDAARPDNRQIGSLVRMQLQVNY